MVKNYITPNGYKRLKEEVLDLLNNERPEVVKTVRWAASNGDRSENGDYIYGKRRLREIDKRIRFLTNQIDQSVVIDPAKREHTNQIFFGATVTLVNKAQQKKTYSIVGTNETNVPKGHISWVSPLAKALLKSYEGSVVRAKLNKNPESLKIIKVEYQKIT